MARVFYKIKSSLRKKNSNLIDNHNDYSIKNRSLIIGDSLLNILFGLKQYNSIGIYIANKQEVSIDAIFSKILTLQCTLSLPFIDDNNLMNYCKVENVETYSDFLNCIDRSSKLRIFEPRLEFKQNLIIPNIVLVPIKYGFNRKKFRLGMGMGHFDKYLQENKNIIKIGLSYSFLEIEENFQETFDIPMDFIITDKEVIY